jgi:hypothetical protein
MSHHRYITTVEEAVQSDSEHCFCGGVPLMPAAYDLPICEFCGAQQTFFFQVRLDAGSVWGDRLFAVFHCTECADENYFIPPMIKGKLAGAHIADDFLMMYQKNFRLIHFSSRDELILRRDSVEKIRFSKWIMNEEAGATVSKSFIGGNPEWVQEDEAPGEYGFGGSFEFLMQIADGTEFNLLEHAPGQVTLGLDRKPKRSARRSYRLFLGNRTFFFGAVNEGHPAGIYVITQRH